MIIFLSVVCVVLFIWVLAITAHIGKIQKELADISKEQSAQNEDIRKLIHNTKNLILSVNDMAEYLNEQKELNSIKPWNGQMPKA